MSSGPDPFRAVLTRSRRTHPRAITARLGALSRSRVRSPQSTRRYRTARRAVPFARAEGIERREGLSEGRVARLDPAVMCWPGAALTLACLALGVRHEHESSRQR